MYITDIVYLLDVLVVIVYMSYCNCWDYLLLHEDWGECSEDWAGAWCGGGGEVEFLTEKKIPLRNVPGVLKRKKNNKYFFSLLNFFFKNVPGVLKRMQKKNFFGGGGILGCLGRPTPPPGVARGRKTIHFFLWP